MEIPIRFRLLLFWKNMFIRQSKAPKINISKASVSDSENWLFDKNIIKTGTLKRSMIKCV